MQYLYDDGDEVAFMDEETYEQFTLPRSDLADELTYMQPSSRSRSWPWTARRPASSCPPRSSSR